jgi:hypothetical protein
MNYVPLADRQNDNIDHPEPPTTITVPTTNKILRYGIMDMETGEITDEDMDWTTAMVVAFDCFCNHYETWGDPDSLLISMDNPNVCHIPY